MFEKLVMRQSLKKKVGEMIETISKNIITKKNFDQHEILILF